MPTYDIIDLRIPIGRNGLGTVARDLNDKGQAAGGSFYMLPPDPTLNEQGPIATYWNDNGTGTLLESPGVRSLASGINDAGSVIGEWGSAPTQSQPGVYPKHGFLYRNGSMIDLGPILGTEYSFANSINNSDVVVGSAGSISQGQPFVYDAAAGTPPVFLGTLPGHETASAKAINDAGVVVGTSSMTTISSDQRCFLYDGTSLIDLAPVVDVTKISNTGLIAGSIASGGQRVAAVYDSNAAQPQFTPIGQLPGHTSGIASSVNDQGDVVGHSLVSGNYSTMRGFLYQDGVMSDLNDLIPANSGWVLEVGTAINNAGQILAHGTYLGTHRSCLLVPSDSWLFSRDFLLVVTILFGVIQDGGGLVLPPGGPPIPIDPLGWHRLGRDRQDILTGLAVNQMASLVRDPAARRHVGMAGLRVIEASLRKLMADLDAGLAPRPGASRSED